ncbi:MAG: hypothetical protein A3I26_03315 [Candidatus Yanofskybacteria bacterium RIFCSPLOWO2_02_FULL_43_10]|nr:MAG: hypothetical protein A3I26_03315 [Candidatus Yanofskybacteria bacterium RIFCSPLOWO2_02_FULL_43_10]
MSNLGNKNKKILNCQFFSFFLFLSVFCFLLSANIVSAQTDEEKMADLKAQIQALEQQAEQLKGTISQKQEQADTLKNQIANLKSQITSLQTQISLTGKKIDKTKIELNNVQNNIFNTQEKVDRQKNTIGRLLLFMDRMDKESLLGIILKNNDLSDYFRQTQSALTANTNLMNLVDDLQDMEDQLNQNKNNLEGKKNDLESLKRQQSAQKSSLDQATKDKDGLLKATKGQEAAYQKMLEEVEIKQSLFFTELKEIETKVIQGGLYILHVKAENLPKKGTDLFRWPEDGFTTTQTYGCTKFARCGSSRGAYGGAIHNGIDIKVGYGTSIKAIGDGEIVANGKNDGWGNWVAIKHPPYNLVSIYAHMSAFEFVRVGSQVKAGDIIGYEGSTGFSTGSHVHLSIYKEFFTYVKEKNGQLYFNYDNTIDPRDYLP